MYSTAYQPSTNFGAPSFRGARRTRFATYAAWWIMNAVSRAVRDQRWMIGIPSPVYRGVIRLVKASYKLQNTLSRFPTIDELVTALDLAPHVVTRAMRHGGCASEGGSIVNHLGTPK